MPGRVAFLLSRSARFVARDAGVDGIGGNLSTKLVVDESGVGSGLTKSVDGPSELVELRVLLLGRGGQLLKPGRHVGQALLEGRHHVRVSHLVKVGLDVELSQTIRKFRIATMGETILPNLTSFGQK